MNKKSADETKTRWTACRRALLVPIAVPALAGAQQVGPTTASTAVTVQINTGGKPPAHLEFWCSLGFARRTALMTPSVRCPFTGFDVIAMARLRWRSRVSASLCSARSHVSRRLGYT